MTFDNSENTVTTRAGRKVRTSRRLLELNGVESSTQSEVTGAVAYRAPADRVSAVESRPATVYNSIVPANMASTQQTALVAEGKDARRGNPVRIVRTARRSARISKAIPNFTQDVASMVVSPRGRPKRRRGPSADRASEKTSEDEGSDDEDNTSHHGESDSDVESHMASVAEALAGGDDDRVSIAESRSTSTSGRPKRRVGRPRKLLKSDSDDEYTGSPSRRKVSTYKRSGSQRGSRRSSVCSDGENSEEGYDSDSSQVSKVTITSKYSERSRSQLGSTRMGSNGMVKAENRLESVSDLYHEAKMLFRRCAKPSALIGRAKEKDIICKFFDSHVLSPNNITGSLYISGCPGTGKTAVVDELLRIYGKKVKGLPVKLVKFNCMVAKDPRSIFSSLLKHITGQQLSSKEALVELKSIFNPLPNTPNSRNPIRYALVLDEIDYLITKGQDILYSFFDMSILPGSQLSLIGIANALDLTERFLPRLKAKGYYPTLLNFNPYEMPQIKEIITNKVQQFNAHLNELLAVHGENLCIDNGANVPQSLLSRITSSSSISSAATFAKMGQGYDSQPSATNSIPSPPSSAIPPSSPVLGDIKPAAPCNFKFNVIEPMAVELCARKIAGTGDVRKALDICRLAIEMTETEVKMNRAKLSQQQNPAQQGFIGAFGKVSQQPPRAQMVQSTNSPTSVDDLIRNQLKSVSMKHMIMATRSAFGTGSTADKIKGMNLHLKLVLCAMTMLLTTGKGDLDLTSLYNQYIILCRTQTIGVPPVSRTELQDLITNLEAHGMLTVSSHNKRARDMSSLKRILQLNVQKSEIVDAVKEMPMLINVLEGKTTYQMKSGYTY